MEANPHHYVEMAEFGLLQESDGGESSTSGWGAVSNLDQFFSTMYSYYYSKGLPTMCVTGITNLLTLGFTIVLSTCLFALVDYAALLECRDESSCHALGDYVTREMLSRYPVRGALAMCYFALFFAYWAWSAVSLALSLRDAAEMHRFFVERLGVSTRELQTMTWHEVVERVVRLQESGEYKIAIHRRALSAHDIACRVMRKENYLIAFINQGILALHVPVPRALARALRAGRAGRAAPDGATEPGAVATLASETCGACGSGPCVPRLYLAKTLEWSLRVCILNHMLSHKFTVRREFMSDEAGLRRRFVLMGLCHIVLMPFTLVFMAILFFLQNAQEWHSKKCVARAMRAKTTTPSPSSPSHARFCPALAPAQNPSRRDT